MEKSSDINRREASVVHIHFPGCYDSNNRQRSENRTLQSSVNFTNIIQNGERINVLSLRNEHRVSSKNLCEVFSDEISRLIRFRMTHDTVHDNNVPSSNSL